MPSDPNPARKGEIRSLFLKLLGTAPENRGAVLEATCGSDEGLRRELEELLAAHEGADDRLWSLARRARAPLAHAHPGFFAEGRRLGAYRLLRQIGQGGMGAVYLAERADGEFEKRVAVKLLPLGLNTGPARERFLAERQILAQLEHPGIARLLDAGIAEDGTPFFVMEYVEGESIDRYCDRRRLGIDGRIDLFLRVSSAVEYAHRNLVVHRDIKRSNILVSSDGAPKLLDFGIAKLLDNRANPGASAQTHTGLRLMTPQYASPEQMRGERVTTASDVYQLGMLLYELLVGGRPYRLTGGSPLQIERAISAQEPTPPSAVLDRATDRWEADGTALPAPDELARVRHADARGLRSRLRGDLDMILLKAVRLDPDRRYASAKELADDLRRHLTGRPVAARPDSWGYRARKFILRNPVSVAATILVLLAGSGYAGMQQAYASRVERERDRAEQALERALVETAKAEQVAVFLSRLFENADPAQTRGAALTVREVLDQALEQIEDLPANPEVRAELLTVMARVHGSLALHEPAVTLAAEALELRRQLNHEPELIVVESLRLHGMSLHAAGDADGAESALREALAMGRQVLGNEDLLIAELLEELVEVLRPRGGGAEFNALRSEAIEIREKFLAGIDGEDAETWMNRGLILRAKRYPSAALDAYEAELAIRIKMDGEDHPETIDALLRLGEQLKGIGDQEGAMAALREVIELSRRTFGEDHPSTAWPMTYLSTELRLAGRYDEAARLSREALELRRRALHPEHPDITTSLVHLAWALNMLGDYDGAEQSYREALERTRRNLGEDHPQVSSRFQNLARVALARGDLLRAEELQREALARPAPPGTRSWSWSMLGRILHAQGDLQGAEELHRKALAEDPSFENPAGRARILVYLGAVLMDRGDLDGAEDYIMQGAELMAAAYGETLPHLLVDQERELERLRTLREAAATANDGGAIQLD